MIVLQGRFVPANVCAFPWPCRQTKISLPDLVGRLTAVGGHHFRARLWRIPLDLQALLRGVRQPLVTIVLPLLCLARATLLQLGAGNTPAIMGNKMALPVQAPLLGLGTGIAFPDDHPGPRDIPEQSAGGLNEPRTL